MRRYNEKALDIAEYTVGAPLFFIVSAVTAAAMAVGFVVMTAADRLLH